MVFNRQQLMENISNLIQQKNMKVGEVEQAIGVSTGYLARLAKSSAESIPATDVVWKLARHFGVSTDALISADFSKGMGSMSILRRFIAKLNTQTMEGILDWVPITTKYVNAVLKGDEPLFFLVKEMEKDYGHPEMTDDHNETNSTYACYGNRKVVSAAAPQDYAWLTGDGFKAKVSDGNLIYLFRMCADLDTGTPAGSVEIPYYEMVMNKWIPNALSALSATVTGKQSGRWEAVPVYNTLGAGGPLEEATRELYSNANQIAYDLKINAAVKDTIMSFLNGDAGGTENGQDECE